MRGASVNTMKTEIHFGPTESPNAALRIISPVTDVATGEAARSKALVRRRPGRPRKVELRPTVDDLSYHAVMAVERERFIASDPLVTAILARRDTASILAIIMMQIAEESGSLAFECLEAQKRGRDAAQTSSRRVDALKKVAEIQLQRRALEGDVWDLSSERFQRLFAMWVGRLSDVLRTVLPPAQTDIVMSTLATAMARWEVEASEIT